MVLLFWRGEGIKKEDGSVNVALKFELVSSNVPRKDVRSGFDIFQGCGVVLLPVKISSLLSSKASDDL